MVNKKVLVCCGTGIATSVQVANKLQRMLRDRGEVVGSYVRFCPTDRGTNHVSYALMCIYAHEVDDGQ